MLPDGTVLCGKLEQPVAAGSVFDFGTDQPIWRILSVDKDADTALVIADSPLSYSDFERFENNSDEYFHSAFSDAEREAILETEIEEDGKAEKTHFFFLEEEEMGRCSRIFPDGNDYWFSPGGGILYEFDGVYGDNTIGERPAFYIDLQSEAFRSMLSKGRSGEPVIPGYALQIKAGELFHVHPLVGEVKLPAYVKKIGSYACFRCYALTSVSWEGTR